MKELQICNIESWHRAGYTGKGVAIDVLESESVNDHGRKVQHVLRSIAPDAIVKQATYDLVSLRNSTAQLINISLNPGGYKLRTKYEIEAVERGITIVVSAGNEGASGMSDIAKTDHVISVGAVHLDERYGIYARAYYSGYDKYGPDIMGFAKTHKVDGAYLLGTSFASPWVTGMLACWYQWHYEHLDRYPTPDEALKFVVRNAIPMAEAGTGVGLFVLPDLKEIEKQFTKLELTIGEQIYYVDGQEKQMDVAPFIHGIRTMVPLRFIAEELGCIVKWDEKNRKITIIQPKEG